MMEKQRMTASFSRIYIEFSFAKDYSIYIHLFCNKKIKKYIEFSLSVKLSYLSFIR